MGIASSSRRRTREIRVEHLEPRTLLDSHGLLWGVDAGLSLSFVPDGAKVGSEANALFETFDRIAPTNEWQNAILRGFQTWARHTNADIGVVPDDGSVLGIAGATTGDVRFGDIRIAAIPMASDVFATSIPTDEFVDGTWVGDVFFNREANLESLDELFAVALHEAGHVFGLDHTGDINSPMYRHEIPASITPTRTDIAALQENFGLRRLDPSENSGKKPNFEPEVDHGRSTPDIVFGDISDYADIDLFELETRDLEDGPITVQLITDGISLLKGQLSLVDEAGTVLAQSKSNATTARDQVLSIESLPRDGKLFIQVKSDQIAPFDVGGYSVVVSLDDTNVVAKEVIDRVARSRIRSIEQDDIRRFFATDFDDDDEVLVDDDHGSDDELGNEIELGADDAFPTSKRFVTIAAISSTDDIDRYHIRVPDDQRQNVITVSLASMTSDFRGELIVRNDEREIVETHQVINGEASSIAQVGGVMPGDEFTFEVKRHRQSMAEVGNYELFIRFSDQLATRDTWGTVTLTPTSNPVSRELRVLRPQLFQFGMQAETSVSSNAEIYTRIIQEDGQVVTEFKTQGTNLATQTVLLLPGLYRMEFSLGNSVTGHVRFVLSGNAIDHPLGPEPVDTTEDPILGFEWFGEIVTLIRIKGDVNGDGLVTFEDFLKLSSSFGRHNAERADGDLNGDKSVSFADFLILTTNFGLNIPEDGSA